MPLLRRLDGSRGHRVLDLVRQADARGVIHQRARYPVVLRAGGSDGRWRPVDERLLLLLCRGLRHAWRRHAGHSGRHAGPRRTDAVAHLLLLELLLLLARVELLAHGPRSDGHLSAGRAQPQPTRVLSREGNLIGVLHAEGSPGRLVIGRRRLLLLPRPDHGVLADLSHAVGHHTGLLLLALPTAKRDTVWTLLQLLLL